MSENNTKNPGLDELIEEIDQEITTEPTIAPIPHTGQGKGAMDILKSRQDQYIRFILEDIRLAIPLQSALEIGHRPEITPLPNLPEWVLGVSNIRGEIVSIVDLKGFFRMKTHGLKRDSRFIILYNPEIKTGIIVDRVLGLLTLDRLREEIRTNPYAEGEISNYISEVVMYEDHLLNILDVDKLLSSPRMDAFRGE